MNKLILPEKLLKEEENSNVVPFPVVPGGKDPTDNWLERIPKGSIFLCEPRAPKGQINVFALEYHIVFKLAHHTKLFENINEEERFFWVNTKNFSMAFELAEVIFEPVAEGDDPEQEE